MSASKALVRWEDSVARARTAMLKSFEGCMEAAAASFEQIAPNSSERDGALARFATESGIALSTLVNYRVVKAWLGEDDTPQGVIPTFSLAREAKATGRWETGAEFVAFTTSTEPPIGRASWTVDALREYVGKTTTRPKPGAKRTTPRDFEAADKLAKEFATALAGADPEVRDFAFSAVDTRLHQPTRPAGTVATDKHPKTKAGATARRCEGLILKALSTDAEPERHAFIDKAYALIAEHGLAYEVKVGVRR